jgi:hypothetical protein
MIEQRPTHHTAANVDAVILMSVHFPSFNDPRSYRDLIRIDHGVRMEIPARPVNFNDFTPLVFEGDETTDEDAVKSRHDGLTVRHRRRVRRKLISIRAQIQRSHFSLQASLETLAHPHDPGAPEHPVCLVTCILVRYARLPLPGSRYHADVV